MVFPTLEFNMHRCVGARFNRLTLLGLYFPVMEAKRHVFAFLKALPRQYLKKESLIIGDLNTGCRYWDEGRMDLSLVEEFGALLDADGPMCGECATLHFVSGRGLSPGAGTSAIG